MTKAPTFEKGDRVKLWGKAKEAGTVTDVWLDGPNKMISVKWESGVAEALRAYRLQFA